jgi:hypothetical protein
MEVKLAKIGLDSEPVDMEGVLSIDIGIGRSLFRISTTERGLKIRLNGDLLVYPEANNAIELREDVHE